MGGEGTFLRVPPLGLKRPKNRKIGSGECVKVSFDISNIHVVVAERCCKRGIAQTLQKSGISW